MTPAWLTDGVISLTASSCHFNRLYTPLGLFGKMTISKHISILTRHTDGLGKNVVTYGIRAQTLTPETEAAPEGAADSLKVGLCLAYHFTRTPEANAQVLSSRKPLLRPPVCSVKVTPA